LQNKTVTSSDIFIVLQQSLFL